MKNLVYPFLFLLVIACGKKETTVADTIASNDIKSIRAKKKELATQQQNIIAQIKQLNTAIEKLDPNKKVPLVTTFTIKDTLFNHYIELQGSLQTKQNLVLTPEYAGILSQVFVKEGQYVNRGQVLARIDDGGLSQQLSQMEIQTQLAKTTFERQERLWNQKIGSEIQYLQAKTAYEAQEKAVDQMKSTIAKTSIRAPFNGRIDDVITEKGAVVAPGQTQVFRIVNLSQMYVEAEVPERYVSTIKKGTSVSVDIPVIGKTLNAKVRQAGSFINPANRTYKVEVAVPNKEKNIKPNLTAKLKINDYTNPKALLIPQSLISENAAGDQYVFAVNKNNKNETIATQKTIITGLTQGSLVEVMHGIKAGDILVSEGARSVKNQQPIEVLN
ncbi:efflux RND transporter periplasmic adaptor subunit [Aquimarina agarilytica]|uniref:efflux RND transporter periplasmic adaptor subunit n=1 Tax=Aquimarina agarilytica TaxID=1087449 RepID=UPI00028869A4|nr:efflux RND transporter periplasmic adaptor subunit [Aquimarina agarilytica]